MKVTKWTCDKCGKEIKDTAYLLTCYAQDVKPIEFKRVSKATQEQNLRQNYSYSMEAHLCRECKDKITDGVFIV